MVSATAAVVASSAFAGPTPTTTCLATMTTVNTTGDLIVPAGTICHLEFPTVGGNVTVAGTLITNGYTFAKNVTVNGGRLELQNGGRIAGNLSISNTLGRPPPSEARTRGASMRSAAT